MKMKCSVCGLNSESSLCFRCKRRKPISVKKTLPRAVNTNLLEIKTKETGRMKAFFLSQWIQRPHRSEISGIYLGNEPLTIFFHHLIPKNNFPKAMYDPDNIFILSGDEHASVEANKYKYEAINKRREMVLEKYCLK